MNADNTISVKLGKVELGQGSMTGLLMVAAEELNADMSQMRWITNDTDVTPNQGTTAGSSAISSRRQADPRRLGGRLPDAARPRLDPARRAGRQPDA